ncbi:hypothetical protein, partial [Bacteroides finegoldii]|uniref:hypothetical protein n=1 Tax=Bacteroides finegoldii TaxID=338188 RepID=UPI001E4DC106
GSTGFIFSNLCSSVANHAFPGAVLLYTLIIYSLSFNRINPKKGRICLPIQRKAVLLQADYYHKMIRD